MASTSASTTAGMRQLDAAFHRNGCEMPDKFRKFISTYGSTRKEVYRRMFGILKYGSKIGDGKMLVFPLPVREYLRGRFGEPPQPAGAHDGHYDTQQNAYHVSIKEIADAKWPR